MIIQKIIISALLIITIMASISSWIKYFTAASIGTNTTQYNIAVSTTYLSIVPLFHIFSWFVPICIELRGFIISINILGFLVFASRFSLSLNLKYKRWYAKNKNKKITTARMNMWYSVINAFTPFIMLLLILLYLVFDAHSTYKIFTDISMSIFSIIIFINIPYIGTYRQFKISTFLLFILSIISAFTPNILFIQYIHQLCKLFLMLSYSMLALNMYLFKKDDPLS